MTLTTRYALGQSVHFLYLDAPESGKITAVQAMATASGRTARYDIVMPGRTVRRFESEVFPSRRELTATTTK